MGIVPNERGTWQMDAKGGSISKLPPRLGLPAMLFGDSLDECQAQAPPPLRLFLFTSPIKRLEKTAEFLRWNRRSGIPDFQYNSFFLDFGSQLHFAASRAVFNGVA